jgi:hypothetical protein
VRGFGGIRNGSFDRKERAETGKRRKRTTSVEERARSRSQRQARNVLPSAIKWWADTWRGTDTPQGTQRAILDFIPVFLIRFLTKKKIFDLFSSVGLLIIFLINDKLAALLLIFNKNTRIPPNVHREFFLLTHAKLMISYKCVSYNTYSYYIRLDVVTTE